MNPPARQKQPAPETLPAASEGFGLPDGYDSATSASLAVQMAVAEVDQQIATAHAYPRSIDKVMKNILTLATLDEETAKECIYALPRANKIIPGPSIRLAEIMLSQWQNARVGTRVTHVDRFEKYVEAEGIFHDLETNVATTARVRRRISDKRGRLYDDDMIMVTSNAAAAIAKRNAILAGVPKGVWRRAYDEVRRVLTGDVRTMAAKRDDAIKAFATLGVTQQQLFEALEVSGPDDIDQERYLNLVGMHQAIRSGEATIEEMFPVKRELAAKPGNLGERLDALAGEPARQQQNSPTGLDASSPPVEEGGGGSGNTTAAADNEPPADLAAKAGAGGSATDNPPSQPGAAADLKQELIDKVFFIAAETNLTEQERLENLENAIPLWEDALPEDTKFVHHCFTIAAKVVRGEQKPTAARRFLESLKEA